MESPERSHRPPLAALVGLVALAAGCSRGEPTELRFEGLAPAHVRVVWTERPQTEALIAWSTAEAGSTHTLFLDERPHRGDPTAFPTRVPTTRDGRFTRTTRSDAEQPTVYFHQVELRELKPSTTYWFVVMSDQRISREFSFTTAPTDDRPITLLAGSDSRSRPERRREFNLMVADLVEESDSVLAFLHGGDYVYNGHEIAEMAQWLSDWELTVPPSGRLLPIVPTRGNHESTSAVFDEAFGSPGSGRGYYLTEFGPNLALITLNTETAAEGDQLEFLRQSLESTGSHAFRVAQYHQALYPAVKKPHAARQVWVPVFERLGLDLAMESDGHALKRTVPILADQRDPLGVVYIGEGGYGVTQRATRERWYLQKPGHVESTVHLWRLTVAPERLQMEAIAIDRKVLDSSELAARDS